MHTVQKWQYLIVKILFNADGDPVENAIFVGLNVFQLFKTLQKKSSATVQFSVHLQSLQPKSHANKVLYFIYQMYHIMPNITYSRVLSFK